MSDTAPRSSPASPTPPPSDASRADEEKRARILEAAFEASRRRGVIGARMEEVAALAQVSKGTLYRFFESKQQLFLAMIMGSYEGSLQLVETRPDGDDDPRRRLARLLDGLADVLGAVAPRMTVHYQAWGLIAGEPEFQSRLYGFLRRFHGERCEDIEALLREGQRAGRFRADSDPAAVADGITALLTGFLYRATFDPQGASPARLRACFDVLVRDRLLAPGAASDAGNRRG